MSNIYDFTVEDARGKSQPLSQYQGKLVLVVNTASKCGYTPQYKDLQELYNNWHARGLEILAFPCNQFGKQEQGSNEEIQEFCQINFGLTFPVFAKIEVNGENAHPLYQYLTALDQANLNGKIRWNFTKFLVGQNGEVVDRYEPAINPLDIGVDIQKLLENK